MLLFLSTVVKSCRSAFGCFGVFAQIKKFKHLISRAFTTTSKTTNTFNTVVTSSTSSSIQDRWVINHSKKELTPEGNSRLQKGPKFAVTPATIPVKEYISTTTVTALQAGELNGVDCSGLYHDVNRIQTL